MNICPLLSFILVIIIEILRSQEYDDDIDYSSDTHEEETGFKENKLTTVPYNEYRMRIHIADPFNHSKVEDTRRIIHEMFSSPHPTPYLLYNFTDKLSKKNTENPLFIYP